MKPIFFVFYCIAFCAHAMDAPPPTYYSTYLKKLAEEKKTPEHECTFNARPLKQASVEALKLSTAKYKNIIVAIDMSGSTKLGYESSGTARRSGLTPEMADQVIYEQCAKKLNSIVDEEELVSKLYVKLLNLNQTRHHADFASKEKIREKIQSFKERTLKAPAPPETSIITPASEAKPELEVPVITKHISLAEVEGLALLLQALAHTNIKDSNFYLSSFSANATKPVGLDFPHHIKSASEYGQIANNLIHHLAPPEFSTTQLATALQLAFNAIGELSGDTLLIIVTDGETFDAERTARMLAQFRQNHEDADLNLDIIAVGAGSVAVFDEKLAQRSVGLRQEKRLVANFSKSGGSLGSCNMGYCISLTEFRSSFGVGVYEGAYKNYDELEAKVVEALASRESVSNALYELNNGRWVITERNHRPLVRALVKSNQDSVSYDQNGQKITARLLEEDPSNSVMAVTDGSQITRHFIVGPPKLISLNSRNGRLNTTNEHIQNAIQLVEKHYPEIDFSDKEVPALVNNVPGVKHVHESKPYFVVETESKKAISRRDIEIDVHNTLEFAKANNIKNIYFPKYGSLFLKSESGQNIKQSNIEDFIFAFFDAFKRQEKLNAKIELVVFDKAEREKCMEAVNISLSSLDDKYIERMGEFFEHFKISETQDIRDIFRSLESVESPKENLVFVPKMGSLRIIIEPYFFKNK